eukprot:UN00095
MYFTDTLHVLTFFCNVSGHTKVVLYHKRSRYLDVFFHLECIFQNFRIFDKILCDL